MRRVPISGNRPDPGFPCYYCQVRPDVSCKHRDADPTWSMGPEPPEDGRVRSSGGGHYSIPKRR